MRCGLFIAIYLAATIPAKTQERTALESWDGIEDKIANFSDAMVFDGGREDVVRYTRCQISPNFIMAPDWSNEEEVEYLAQARQKWKTWWQNSGSKIALQREQNARDFPHYWSMAAQTLHGKVDPLPEAPGPIWVPGEWTFNLNFGAGDYMGMRRERWILRKTADSAQLIRVTGSYNVANTWEVACEAITDFSTEHADRFMGALTYLLEYRLQPTIESQPWEAEPYYYPGGSMQLKSTREGLIWSKDGYWFFPYFDQQYLGGPVERNRYPDVGVAYALLRTVFADSENWRTIYAATDSQRRMLREFDGGSGDSRILLSEFGTNEDLEILQAEVDTCQRLEKLATIPLIDRIGRFSVSSRVNAKNMLEHRSWWARFYRDKLKSKLAQSAHPPAARIETRATVDWSAAGRAAHDLRFWKLEVGKSDSVELDGITYTWRVAAIQNLEPEGSFSGLSLVRQSATAIPP